MGTMKTYVRDRVTVDAKHALELAEQQEALVHYGLRGRMRELIAQRILRPWFPPYIGCGTGTIIQGSVDETRTATQDDIIIFDRTLMPPILIEEIAAEGVFLNNSVLARIEVKSRLTAAEIEKFAKAAKEYSGTGFVVEGHSPALMKMLKARSALLAMKSDTENASTEITRYVQGLEAASCPEAAASIFCVTSNGLWMLRQTPEGSIKWHRLKSGEPAQRLACFVAILSATIADAHLERTGVDRSNTLARGIGLYFPRADEWEIEPAVN